MAWFRKKALFGKKELNREIDFINNPIGALYRRLLPSAIGSLLTSTVASMIDVAILSYYLGTDMLAVVGFCMPVYMLVNTLGMLIASGAATLYSQYLGEENKTEAMRFFSASVTHTIACGVILTLGGLLFTDSVVKLLGAGGPLAEPTTEYLRVLFFFMTPLMVYVHLLFFVRIDSDSTRVLIATIVCAVTNLGLDILFVGLLGMGPKGAAIATCLAYTLGMAVNLGHFWHKRNTLRWMKGCLKGRSLRIWRVGLPLAAAQLGMTVSTNIFNNVIVRVGGENYISVLTAIIQLSMTSMAIYDGVGQAALPIMAAASGARLRDRIIKVFRYGVRLELIGTVGLAVVYAVFAGPIAGIFSIRDGDLVKLAVSGFRIYALSIPFIGLNSIIMYFFQAQEKTVRALMISLLSGSVLLIASLLVLTSLFHERGVWFSWVAGQGLTLVISVILFWQSQQGKKVSA